MTLTPSTRFNKISWIENHKNHCFITKFSPVKSLLLGDSIIAGWKRYDNVWMNDRVENGFWRAINLPKMPYLEHVIILRGADNINKDSPVDIAECLIEISKYPVTLKLLFPAYFFEMNVGLSTELSLAKLMIFWLTCFLHGFCFIEQNYGWTREIACLTLICILKIMSTWLNKAMLD